MNSAASLSFLSSATRRLCGLLSTLPKNIKTITGIQCLDSTQRSISCSMPVTKSFVVKDDDEFMHRVMQSDVPVIVNFHAEWCDPCKILSPKLKELVDPLQDVDLAVVDVESHPELVHTFEVKAVPAVLAVKNGLVVDKFIGLVDADMIENLVNKLTGKDPITTSSTETIKKATPIDSQGGPVKQN